jgi:prepilin-type N-terminal cleavage/methylation domain-containing protein
MHNLKIKGFTLVELMVSIAVLAVVITLAAPSFKEAIERRHLEGAASSIHLGLQRAKSEAVKQNADVYFDATTGVSWCYGIVDNATSCDCANSDCTINSQVVTVTGTEFDNVTLRILGVTPIKFDKTVGLPNATPTFEVTLNGNTRTIAVNAAGLITTN